MLGIPGNQFVRITKNYQEARQNDKSGFGGKMAEKYRQHVSVKRKLIPDQTHGQNRGQ